MNTPQFVSRESKVAQTSARFIPRKGLRPDPAVLISLVCNGLAILGVAAQSFIDQSVVSYILFSSFFLFGGIAGCVAGVVGIRRTQARNLPWLRTASYSAGIGVLLGLTAYASFMLQLNNFSRSL